MNNFISNAKWRYATKKFDATKRVSPSDLDTLKEAIQLTASSFGLQPYKILIIENPEIKAQLKAVSWGQSQVVDASHIFVFANILDFNDQNIDDYISTLVATRGVSMESIKNYADFMKSKIASMSIEERNNWTSKQAYLALGNLLNVASELKIDVTPMEGFEPEKVNEILGLSALGLNATLIAPVGYRHSEDSLQHLPKVRKSIQELFINL